jgi:hypothetical protein
MGVLNRRPSFAGTRMLTLDDSPAHAGATFWWYKLNMSKIDISGFCG